MKPGVLDLGDGFFVGYERGDISGVELSAAAVVQVVDGCHRVVECDAWPSGDDLAKVRELVASAGRAARVPLVLPRWSEGEDPP